VKSLHSPVWRIRNIRTEQWPWRTTTNIADIYWSFWKSWTSAATTYLFSVASCSLHDGDNNLPVLSKDKLADGSVPLTADVGTILGSSPESSACGLLSGFFLMNLNVSHYARPRHMGWQPLDSTVQWEERQRCWIQPVMESFVGRPRRLQEKKKDVKLHSFQVINPKDHILIWSICTS